MLPSTVGRYRQKKGAFLAGSSPAGNVTPDRQSSSGDEPSTPLRVLIVDDDRDTLLTLGLLCREAGMYVHLLRSGAEVMEAVASFRPHVVVLDLVLPDRSGLEIAEEIALRYGDDQPVLVAITKMDKFGNDAGRERVKAIAESLDLDTDQVVPVSARTGLGRDDLAAALTNLLGTA